MTILFQWEGERLHYSLLIPWCHNTTQHFLQKNEPLSCKEQTPLEATHTWRWAGRGCGEPQVLYLSPSSFSFSFSLFLSLSLPDFKSTPFWNGQFRLITDLEKRLWKTPGRCRCKGEAEPQDMQAAVESKIRGTWAREKATKIGPGEKAWGRERQVTTTIFAVFDA